MTDSPIRVENPPKGERIDWKLTERPFKRTKPSERAIESYGGWDKIKYAVGFKNQDLNTWREKKYSVLEIGPGQGISTEQLLDEERIDIYAIEPSLRYPSSPNYSNDPNADPSGLTIAKRRFSQEKFNSRIKAVTAADAARAFPDKTFDVAFAIGPNFHNFSVTENVLVNQLAGVMQTLSSTQNSYFAFEVEKETVDAAEEKVISFNMQDRKDGVPNKKFRLTKFLDDNGIKYTTEEIFGSGDRADFAIRIFRQSDSGIDAASLIAKATNMDLSKYIT